MSHVLLSQSLLSSQLNTVLSTTTKIPITPINTSDVAADTSSEIVFHYTAPKFDINCLFTYQY